MRYAILITRLGNVFPDGELDEKKQCAKIARCNTQKPSTTNPMRGK